MKKIFIFILCLFLFIQPAYGAGWVEIKDIGWFYDLGKDTSTSPGSTTQTSRYAKDIWLWIPDTSNQRVMYCYYFGPDGRMYQNQTTPDGYTVDETGKWVVNGAKQWRLNENYVEPTSSKKPTIVVLYKVCRRCGKLYESYEGAHDGGYCDHCRYYRQTNETITPQDLRPTGYINYQY